METIADGKVIIEIDAESKGFESGLESAQKAASQLANNELRSVETAANAVSAAFQSTASAATAAGSTCEGSLRGVETVLKNDATAAGVMADALKENAGAVEDAADAVRDADDAIQDETRSTEENTDSTEENTKSREENRDSTEEESDSTEKNTKSTEANTKAKELATKAIKAVVAAAAALGTAMAAGATAAVAAGSAYETAFAKTATIMDTNVVSAEAMSAAIIDLSNETGAAAKELSGSVYDAISATGDTANAVSLVADASKLATAGFAEQGDALGVLTTIMNSYGMEASQAKSISDSLIQTQNLGVTTVGQLSKSMGKAIATASAYSIDLYNLESAYVSLTKAGISTEESTTYLASMFNELGDAGSEVAKIIRDETGMSFGQLMQSGASLADVLDILLVSVNGDKEALANLWGSAEAGKASMAIAGQGVDTFNSNLENLRNSAGTTEKAYETMTQTLGYQTDLLKTRITNLGTTIYGYFDDSLTEGVSSLSDAFLTLTESVTDGELSDEMEQIGAGFADLIESGAELAADVLPAVVDGLAFLVEHGDSAVTMLGGAVAAYGAYQVATTAATNATAILNATIAISPWGAAAAGIVALTAAVVGLGTAIHNATDPVVQIKKHLEDLADAQNRFSDAENITGLCTRYEELRAKTADTSLSSEELSAVQKELAEVRAALSEATNGAISAEGDYSDALDETVGIQKELAEAEKNRANQEIYTQLVKGSKDYQKSLQEQREKQNEIAKAEEKVENYTARLSAAVTQYSAEIEASGKAAFSTSLEMEDAATCADGATESYNALVAELAEMQAATTEYEHSLISLVQDGFLNANDAAALLGISEDALARMMTAYWNETHQASTGTQALAEEHLEAAQAAKEQADAEAEATSAIWDIASAAVDARVSGGDLRAEYEDLSAQLEELRDDGDETAIMWAEQKLKMLEIAATNQELSESYSYLAEMTGYSLSSVSAWLIDSGLTADEWASQVNSAKDSVINGFQELDTSLDMSLQDMAASLRSNIDAYTNWNSNIQTLMSAAVATGSQSAIDFVMYMQEMGIGAADQVQMMVEDIDGTMATFPGLFEEATAAGMTEVYNGIEGGKAKAASAASGMMDGVVTEVESADTESAGAEVGSGAASGIESQQGSVEASAQVLVDSAISTFTNASGDFEAAGTDSGTQIKIGLLLQKESVTAAAQALADGVNTAWTNTAKAFQESGSAADENIASGIDANADAVSSAAGELAQGAVSAINGIDWTSVGYNMAAGIASGIRSGRSGVVNAAVDVVNAAVSAAKSAADINSPSKVMEDEVGFQMTAGVATGMVNSEAVKALEQSAGTITDIVSDQLSGLNDSITDIQAAQKRRAAEKELRDYEESLAELRQKYAEAELEERADIQKQIDEKQADWDEKRLKEQEAAQIESMKSQIEYLEEWQKAYEDAMADYQDSYQEAYNGIMQQQASMAGKLADFGSLYSYNDSGSLRLGDLEQQTLAIEEYGEMLEQLQERGISDDLMQEILGLDIKDAWNYGSRLLGLSDDSYAQYMESWAKKQETAAAIAERFYSDDLDALNTEYVEKIPEVLDGLKDQIGDLGTESAMALAEAFEAQKGTIADAFLSTINAAYSLASYSIGVPVESPTVTVPTSTSADALLAQTRAAVQPTVDTAFAQQHVTNITNYDRSISAGQENTSEQISLLRRIAEGVNSEGTVVNLTFPDGTKLASYMFQPLANYAKANGTPIINPS